MLKPRLTASAALQQGGNASITLTAAGAASARLSAPRGSLELRRSAGAVTAMLAPFFVGAPAAGGSGGSAAWASPHLVWADGRLVRVEYAGGLVKTLQWNGRRLEWVDAFDGAATTRKTLQWNAGGQLVDVVQGGVS
jgi:hypothetical protein